jgi:hypothetical protein
MASVLASMQGNGNETRLRRHEAGAFDHEIDYLILLVGRQFHRVIWVTTRLPSRIFSHGKISLRHNNNAKLAWSIRRAGVRYA